MQTQRASDGLVNSSYHNSHLTVTADMSQPLQPLPVEHTKDRARMIRNRTLVQCSYEPVGEKKFCRAYENTPTWPLRSSTGPELSRENFYSGGPTRVIRLIARKRTGATPPSLGVFNAYGKEGPTASNLQEPPLPTSGQPIIFAPGSTPTSGLRRSARLAQRTLTSVSSARDFSQEEPVIQDANPSDHTFPDVSCECETLELDSQPKNAIHTEVNHDDILSCESSKGET